MLLGFGFVVVLGRVRESGFEDSNIFANFAGEREEAKREEANLLLLGKNT
jgi:hypothetical protein